MIDHQYLSGTIFHYSHIGYLDPLIIQHIWSKLHFLAGSFERCLSIIQSSIALKSTLLFISLFCTFLIPYYFGSINLPTIHLIFSSTIIEILKVSIHLLATQPRFIATPLLITHHFDSKGS